MEELIEFQAQRIDALEKRIQELENKLINNIEVEL